jgi:hypothetical protein
MVALLWPGPVLANGRVKRLVPQDAGPYTISLGTIPQAPALGSLHLTMTVVERSSGAFIMDARVSVTGAGPGGEAAEIGPLVAQNNPLDPTFYDIGTSVDREGTWTFTVGVSSELGDASSDFPIQVARASPLTGIATLLGFLAFLTVLGLSVRVFLRQQRGSAGRVGGRKR